MVQSVKAGQASWAHWSAGSTVTAPSRSITSGQVPAAALSCAGLGQLAHGSQLAALGLGQLAAQLILLHVERCRDHPQSPPAFACASSGASAPHMRGTPMQGGVYQFSVVVHFIPVQAGRPKIAPWWRERLSPMVLGARSGLSSSAARFWLVDDMAAGLEARGAVHVGNCFQLRAGHGLAAALCCWSPFAGRRRDSAVANATPALDEVRAAET